MSGEDAVIVRLGVTPEQLLGYGYAGLLASFVASLIEPNFVKHLIAALGPFLAAIVALALGVGIYVAYFKIVGEFLLYPFHHLVHKLVDRVRKRIGKVGTSCVAYIGELGVPFGQRRAAYEAIKAAYYQDRERRRIQLAHGELHVLYLTAVEAGAAALYLFARARPTEVWATTAIVFYVAALIADLRQHTLECYMLKTRAETELRKFLNDAGYSKRAAA